MKLTQQQFDALTPYRKNFETMVNSRWVRNPGSVALDLINEIYSQVTGVRQRLNKGCSQCIMTLMDDMGRIYLADLKEREEKPAPKRTRKPKVQEDAI